MNRRSTSFAQQLLDDKNLPKLLAPGGRFVLGHTKRDTLELVAPWTEGKQLKDGDTATEDDIRAFCKGQIAHYKIPRYIEFVGEFPMTITGKIQKFVMREQTISKLGLKAEKTA